MGAGFDVIVAGGGPGGAAAAVASARSGARTLLVERYGFLGGMATAGLVNPFMPYEIVHPDTGKREVTAAGLFTEILDGLARQDALLDRAFDEEIIKFVLDDLATEAGVSLLFHSLIVGVRMDGPRVAAVEVENKSGRQSLSASVFVDATGDGDVAAAAGAPFEIGRPEDGLTQSMTTCFNMADVDRDMLMKDGFQAGRRYTNDKFHEAQARGRLADLPISNFRWYHHPRPGVLHFNVTRILRKLGIDVQDLTESEIEARRQIVEIVAWLREEVEPFRNAWLQKVAPQIGVRGSRRVTGDYVVTTEDVVEAKPFPDAVMRGRYGLDIHNPTGPGCKGGGVRPGEAYEVPYRAITPLGVDNLLMSCRAISATFEAHSAIRVMPQMVTLGHAAGVAAAMAARKGGDVRAVDVSQLQDALIEQGANLIKHGT